MDFKIIIYNGEEIRLDRFLRREIPNLTQGIIEKSFRNGLIKVNNKVVKTGFRLKGQEEIKINEILYKNLVPLLPENFSAKAISLAKKILNDYLIYDHPEFIAINKPSKLATQGGSKISLSIDDALSYLNSLGNEYKLVHRIDKDTSGILLIARGYSAASKLTKAFHDKEIQKNYIAIVEGNLPQKFGEIRSFISKNQHIIQKDINQGKLAITKYKLIKKIGTLSLVEFMPITGRMHQLRIHAKEIGCPIVGDKKYGVRRIVESVDVDTRGEESTPPMNTRRLSSETLGNIKSYNYTNMMLHAAQIVLSEEIFGKEIIIEAPIPLYFNKIIYS